MTKNTSKTNKLIHAIKNYNHKRVQEYLDNYLVGNLSETHPSYGDKDFTGPVNENDIVKYVSDGETLIKHFKGGEDYLDYCVWERE